jgi:hypothetical protein
MVKTRLISAADGQVREAETVRRLPLQSVYCGRYIPERQSVRNLFSVRRVHTHVVPSG